MNWDAANRLVADDGEILDKVDMDYSDGSYRVRSTGKTYATRDQAQQAAERRQNMGLASLRAAINELK